MPSHHDGSSCAPDGDYAFEQVMQVAARALSLARYYTAVLLDWHPQSAVHFRDDVLRPLEREDFDAALRGLDAWLPRWYDIDPLMRYYCGGIQTSLRLCLLVTTGQIESEFDD